MNQLTKMCPKCQTKKHRDQFYVDRKRGNALYTYCKECCKTKEKAAYGALSPADKAERNRKHREWVASNKEHLRVYKFASLHGFDYDDVVAVLAIGHCEICGTTEGQLVPDHCHERMVLRGLLCPSCNKALGFFRDDHERLESAIKYLRDPIFQATYKLDAPKRSSR